jgi:hypothetical protein
MLEDHPPEQVAQGRICVELIDDLPGRPPDEDATKVKNDVPDRTRGHNQRLASVDLSWMPS